MTPKRKVKKNIKEDQLVTLALRVSNYTQDHFTQVVSGIVILIAVIAVILFTAQARRNTARAAERELAVAMNQYQTGQKDLASASLANVADRYSGHHPGLVALYFLGECYLSQYRFDDARTAYERYLDRAGDDDLFAYAGRIGLAVCHEGLQEFLEAARLMDDLSEVMDPADVRYNDVLFYAATFYKDARQHDKALEFYRQVAESTGPLRARAATWINLLE